ncbi:MAG: CGNR zinc finger domain-containing protein [candidate division NC10 bacterium]|nr:CGNR zinc finger domain-containing protein [candidate division NC10 bacterium]
MTRPVFLRRWWNQQLRIGETAPARLRWVVEFAQRDLTALTPGEWTDLLSALRTFITYPFPPIAHHHPPRFIYSKGRPRLSQDEVREVQQAYQRFITRLVNKHNATTDELRVTVGAWFIPDRHHPERTVVGVTHSAENLVTDAMWGLFWLLAAHGPLLRQCPERTCRRIFVATRKNQAYCSTQCLSRQKTREYRKRKEKGKR